MHLQSGGCLYASVFLSVPSELVKLRPNMLLVTYN